MKKIFAVYLLMLFLTSCVSDNPVEFLKLPKNERLEIVKNLDARVNIFDDEKDIVYVGTWGSRVFKGGDGYGKDKIYNIAVRFCKEKLELDSAKKIGTKTMNKEETEKYKLWNKVYVKYQCFQSELQKIEEAKKTSNNKSTRSFTCSFSENTNEKSKILINGPVAIEETAIGITINYNTVNISDKGAFTLQGASNDPGRVWFIGAQSFLLLDTKVLPYNCY